MMSTTSSAPYNGDVQLKSSIHDGPASFRVEIAGDLSGEAARQMAWSWSTASSVIGDRSLVVGVGNMSSIDRLGRALLQAWHDAGAEFVAKSALAKTLIASIVGQPAAAGMDVNGYDRWSWLRSCALPLIPLLTMLFPGAIHAASLEPATSKAWEAYIQSATARMEQHLNGASSFLWIDALPELLARVRAGEIVVSPVGAQNPKKVPSGMIHDWVGAVFIPGVTLKDVLQVVRDYARYKEMYRPTVIDSRVIATGETKDRFSMRLLNKSLFLKTALDTEYESCYVHVDDHRAYSISRTTRVQEIEEYGSPDERMLRDGEGNGMIWRLFSIARQVERDGGVYFELEVIGLSRDIPGSLRWLVEPIVRRISRGSLVTSLQETEDAVRIGTGLANSRPDRGASLAAEGQGLQGSLPRSAFR